MFPYVQSQLGVAFSVPGGSPQYQHPAASQRKQHINRLASVCGILFLLSQVTPAQNGLSTSEASLTLDQAISLALENNREVQNAALQAQKSENQLAAYRTHLFPSMKTSALISKPLTPFNLTIEQGALGTFPATGPIPSENTIISSSKKPTAFVVASATQPLSQLWRINLTIKGLRAAEEMSQSQLRTKQQEVVKSVKNAYYSILQTQSQFESAEEMIKLCRELNRVTGEYFTQQIVLKPDLLEVQTRLAKSEYELLVLQNQLSTQKEQFNNLLGRPAQTPFSVSTVIETAQFVMRDADLVAARERAAAQRPEIATARAKVRQAEYERRAKRTEYLPDVSLSFNYLAPINFSEFLPKHIAQVGIQFEWDVFDWGRKKQELAEKTKTLTQARNDLLETENRVVIDVDSKYRKLQETAQMLRVSRLNQETAAANVQVNANQYRIQAVLLKDVLQAQSKLADANYQYQRALLDFWTAKAEFEKATGEDK